jgi:hypothetical membrane protein
MTIPVESREKVNTTLLRATAACGILGPVLFALVVLVLGFLTPGYSPSAQMMSELGEAGAPYALVMNLGGFLLLGILLICFSFGLHAALRPSVASLTGALLVILAGLAYIGLAAFSCDRGCIPVTVAGSFHLFIGENAVFVGVLAAFVLAIAMRPDARWKGYWQYSVATGILVVLLLPLFSLFTGITGAIQRFVVGVILLWMFVIARRTYQIVSKREQAPGGAGRPTG